jgi:hypothetical protein
VAGRSLLPQLKALAEAKTEIEEAVTVVTA